MGFGRRRWCRTTDCIPRRPQPALHRLLEPHRPSHLKARGLRVSRNHIGQLSPSRYDTTVEWAPRRTRCRRGLLAHRQRLSCGLRVPIVAPLVPPFRIRCIPRMSGSQGPQAWPRPPLPRYPNSRTLVLEDRHIRTKCIPKTQYQRQTMTG